MNTVVLVALALAAIAICGVLARSLIKNPPPSALRRVDPADVQAIQDAPPFDQHASQACALTAPDDDRAILAAIEADLIRSRTVRRLARRLETTR